MQAGNDYMAMLDSLEAKDITKAQSQAAALGETPYAPLAVLDLAKAQVEAGQRDAAIPTLRGAESSNPALQQILPQHLARLLIDARQPADALTVLGHDPHPASPQARGHAHVPPDKR